MFRSSCAQLQFKLIYKNSEKYVTKTTTFFQLPPHSQVKTYTDHGNGRAAMGSSHYSKLSPGREYSDNDMELQASQSQDCEPTPPLQRHGSKNNFFQNLPQMDGGQNGGGAGDDSPRHIKMYPRHSPYPKHRQIDPSRDTLSPEALPMINNMQQQQPQVRMSSATPTMQQRIKALGVATPLAISSPIRRSNPGTPTQPRRPDFIGVPMQMSQQQHPAYYDLPMTHGQQMGGAYMPPPPTSQAAAYHHQLYDPNSGLTGSQNIGGGGGGGYHIQSNNQVSFSRNPNRLLFESLQI